MRMNSLPVVKCGILISLLTCCLRQLAAAGLRRGGHVTQYLYQSFLKKKRALLL